MSHRRLLSFPTAASGRLRRSLSTAASDSRGGWSWYMLEKTTMTVPTATGPSVRFADPPRVSELYMPESLFNLGGHTVPGRQSDVLRMLSGQAGSASQDGLLLLNYRDIRIMAPIVGMEQQGGRTRAFRELTGTALPDPAQVPDMAHFVFNPLTREISSRLPGVQGPLKITVGFEAGLLTQQADAGRGPPDRYAVAKLDGHVMLRFLSETGEWETVQVCPPCQLTTPGRQFSPNQEVLAFGGRLWWVDVTWGAVCADPFSDRPEPRFVELPSGSVLPADACERAIRSSIFVPDAQGKGNVLLSMRMPNMCRRVGVSGGCLRYVEVSEKEPFMLSSFVLDGSNSGWTLEHRVALSRLWVDGDHPWLPLQGLNRPQIGVLDPYEANVVHLVVGKHVVAVDMHKGEVTQHVPYTGHSTASILPCVVSPWLPTSQIPSSAGKKDVSKKTTLADVLVRSD
uniref:Uncharacterized protein n=1 Tax=Avena sativa TaxID=4498 RepID=A0ACD5W6H2_AVESA